jgi:hypothetical protein
VFLITNNQVDLPSKIQRELKEMGNRAIRLVLRIIVGWVERSATQQTLVLGWVSFLNPTYAG